MAGVPGAAPWVEKQSRCWIVLLQRTPALVEKSGLGRPVSFSVGGPPTGPDPFFGWLLTTPSTICNRREKTRGKTFIMRHHDNRFSMVKPVSRKSLEWFQQ